MSEIIPFSDIQKMAAERQAQAEQDRVTAEAKAEADRAEIKRLEAALESIMERLDALDASPTEEVQVNFLACGTCHNKTFAVEVHPDGSYDIICALPPCGATVQSMTEAE